MKIRKKSVKRIAHVEYNGVLHDFSLCRFSSVRHFRRNVFINFTQIIILFISNDNFTFHIFVFKDRFRNLKNMILRKIWNNKQKCKSELDWKVLIVDRETPFLSIHLKKKLNKIARMNFLLCHLFHPYVLCDTLLRLIISSAGLSVSESLDETLSSSDNKYDFYCSCSS